MVRRPALCDPGDDALSSATLCCRLLEGSGSDPGPSYHVMPSQPSYTVPVVIVGVPRRSANGE